MLMGQWAASGITHLTLPSLPVRYISAELGYAANRSISAFAIGQKRPGVTLGFEIAQAPVRQANRLAISTDIKFPAGRTTDLESVGNLVAHLISPIRFWQSNNRLSESGCSDWSSTHTHEIRVTRPVGC
jgi:hypothetical protein